MIKRYYTAKNFRPHFVHVKAVGSKEIWTKGSIFQENSFDLCWLSFINVAQKLWFNMGNNPMVGATVAVAVAVEESQK